MACKFKHRGFPDTVLNREFHIFNAFPRHNLLLDKRPRVHTHKGHFSPPVADILFFSTAYSREFNKIRNMVNKYLPVLFNDPTYTDTSQRYQNSLSLLPSLFASENSCSHWLQFKDDFMCGMRRCAYCRHIKRSPSSLFNHYWQTLCYFFIYQLKY